MAVLDLLWWDSCELVPGHILPWIRGCNYTFANRIRINPRTSQCWLARSLVAEIIVATSGGNLALAALFSRTCCLVPAVCGRLVRMR
jgi:hypothetical protein